MDNEILHLKYLFFGIWNISVFFANNDNKFSFPQVVDAVGSCQN